MPRTPKVNVRIREGRFVVDFCIRGKRRRVTVDAQTETEAKMIGHRLFVQELDLTERQPLSAIRVTVADAFEHWEKRKLPNAPAKSVVGRFVRWCGEKQLDAVNVSLLSRYMLEEGARLKASSVTTSMGRVLGFLKWCHHSGLMASRLSLSVPRGESTSPEPLTPAEVQQLLEDISGDATFEPFYLLALLGLRRSEILQVRWEHVAMAGTQVTGVSVNGSMIRVKKSKTRRGEAWLPIFGPIDEWLQVNLKAEGFLVAIPESMQRTGVTFRKLFDRWNSKHVTKLPNPHRCRHTIACELLKGGAGLIAVQQLLRHTSPLITERIYGHVAALDFRTAFDNALPASLKKKAPKIMGRFN